MPLDPTSMPPPAGEALAIAARLGVSPAALAPVGLPARTPITGETITHFRITPPAEVDESLARAAAAFRVWRAIPPPRRGEAVRLLGEELRATKPLLGRLVTLEVGKTVSEGLGEVQEMIDICDFAVGLSRQLNGATIASERAQHRLMETWHPLGPTGIITAFNFPAAVWAWNAALALVCGNPIVWKPSEKASLTALAVHALAERALVRFGDAPDGLSTLLIGGRELGTILADDRRVGLVSATGSTAMGRDVAERLARRFGRAILELGGNNAAIVTPSADLDVAVPAIAFAAMGTAGQRCTTLRRLIVHEAVHDRLLARLRAAYASIRVGDPRDEAILVGPLIDEAAFHAMQAALDQVAATDAEVQGGERILADRYPAAYYVRPALVMSRTEIDVARRETFAPILYAMPYRDLDIAIAFNNGVPQGLASAIFTTDLREAEKFLSAAGSDCGIANVNIGPSGAEIGGAFGGEKETGGGREAGSDAWRNYMRRATNTINYGHELPLAQGVRFELTN